MTVRPPRQYSTAETDPLTAALEHEVMGEKVGTLGRLGLRLEACLARLHEFDEQAMEDAGAPSAEDTGRRERLLADAGEALWHVVIQRELCGLRNGPAFYREYRIPRAVVLRMGPAAAGRR